VILLGRNYRREKQRSAHRQNNFHLLPPRFIGLFAPAFSKQSWQSNKNARVRPKTI
jgi:hypothetical protein